MSNEHGEKSRPESKAIADTILGDLFFEANIVDRALSAYTRAGNVAGIDKCGNRFLEEKKFKEAYEAFRASKSLDGLVTTGNAILAQANPNLLAIKLATNAYLAAGNFNGLLQCAKLLLDSKQENLMVTIVGHAAMFIPQEWDDVGFVIRAKLPGEGIAPIDLNPS